MRTRLESSTGITRAKYMGVPLLGLVLSTAVAAWEEEVQALSEAVNPQVIEWRHHLHANPELGNREFKTAEFVAARLREFGFDEVQTGIAHTGVVGILRGGKPGSVVALRADMDALPVSEQTGLPYASTVTTQWQGEETGVMHACGHDAHMAMLLGAAEVLAQMREDIPGTIKFIFQPAEEGPPPGEEGGARLMIKEGVLEGEDAPKAIFGVHVFPTPVGQVFYKPEGMLSAADGFSIKVRGVQSHGSQPWTGIDPITISGQVITALQNIPSRQIDLTEAPAVITIGTVNGGNRWNIIPDTVEMTGTIRTLDTEMQNDVHERINRTVQGIVDGWGAEADVNIIRGYPVTYNDPALTAQMSDVLDWATDGNAIVGKPIMGSEDFSFFAQEIPGLYVFLGVAKDGAEPGTSPSNHSPYFFVNDKAMPVGVKTYASLALSWLHDAQ